jgi:hypothetical protein
MGAVKGQLQASVAAISNEDTLQLLELLDVLCSSAEGAAAATAAGVLPLLLQSLPMGRSMGSLMGSMSVKLLLVLMRSPGGMQAAQEAGTAQQLSDALQVSNWARVRLHRLNEYCLTFSCLLCLCPSLGCWLSCFPLLALMSASLYTGAAPCLYARMIQASTNGMMCSQSG